LNPSGPSSRATPTAASSDTVSQFAPEQDAPETSLRALGLRLREGGRLSDSAFDEVFPSGARNVSFNFWTPVAVAQRAAWLLVQEGCRRVLDVGSGVGKFCVVGAASTDATFVAIEHRGHLVVAAREAARRIGVSSAHFVHGTLDGMDASEFDTFYFFNPFEENLWTAEVQLDQTVALSERRFEADVKCAQQMLAQARVGTRVVTYYGLGAAMPTSYVLSYQEPHRSSFFKTLGQDRLRRVLSGAPQATRRTFCRLELARSGRPRIPLTALWTSSSPTGTPPAIQRKACRAPLPTKRERSER
jgi:Protein-L-isoaspartate(D-aspartate) O-methyltransferase (PCMT)